MRVLHAIASLDLDRGGPPRSTHSLSMELARCGAQVRLLTASTKGWEPRALESWSDSGGSFEVVVAPGTSYVTRGWKLASWAELVHFQSVWKVSHAILAERCHRLSVPYVLAPRGELDVWSMRQSRLKKQVFLALIGRRLLRNAAALHLLNEAERQGYEALGIDQDTFIVPNGIDPAEWTAPLTEPSVRQRFSQIGDRVIVLFFARLHRKKGGALLAEAFVRVADAYPNSFLIFAGPDAGERARIEAILLEGGMAKRSLILDTQTGEQRRRLLMDADVVALPSVQEGHPRTVLEAGFLGKSLLVTRECHVPELTEQGAAEVVAPNVASVVAGLARLLGDQRYRLEIGRRAAVVIGSDYTWRTMAERQLQMYRQILSGLQE